MRNKVLDPRLRGDDELISASLDQAFFKSTDLILAFNYTWPLASLRGSIGACLIRAIPRPKFA